MQVGDTVLVRGSLKGTVKYIGETHYAKGDWIGVEVRLCYCIYIYILKMNCTICLTVMRFMHYSLRKMQEKITEL